MLPFYRRYVTGRLQRSEFLVNGNSWSVLSKFSAKSRGGRFLAEKVGCRENPFANHSKVAELVSCSSLLHMQSTAECAQKELSSGRGWRSVADLKSQPACLRAIHPYGASSEPARTCFR